MLRRARICYRLSVRPSLTFRYRDHMGWNYLKIISPPNSVRPPDWPEHGPSGATGTPQNWGGRGVRSLRRTKTCNISETSRDRTKVTITGTHTRAFDRCQNRWPWRAYPWECPRSKFLHTRRVKLRTSTLARTFTGSIRTKGHKNLW